MQPYFKIESDGIILKIEISTGTQNEPFPEGLPQTSTGS